MSVNERIHSLLITASFIYIDKLISLEYIGSLLKTDYPGNYTLVRDITKSKQLINLTTGYSDFPINLVFNSPEEETYFWLKYKR